MNNESRKVAGTTPEESFEVDEIQRCPTCNTMIEFYVEPLYKGLRGRCVTCGTNCLNHNQIQAAFINMTSLLQALYRLCLLMTCIS